MSASKRIEPSGIGRGPELVFGLVGAVGTDLKAVSGLIAQELRAVNYRSHEIRMSSLLSQCYKYRKLANTSGGPEDKRIELHMEAGDDLRGTIKRGDSLSLLAISQIREIRKSEGREVNEASPRTAYILNSLKHPDEAKTLSRIYSDSFFLISVYEPVSDRINWLAERIAKSRGRFDVDQYKENAVKLVRKDKKSVDDDYGQNVRDTFPLGDIFISANADLESQIRRFVRLLFGYPYSTPTADEYGMFHARAAALRSADLSRQVGAIITTDEGEIVAAGCNEVPKATGGSVWEDRTNGDNDYRDYKFGRDANTVMKHEIIAEIFEKLKLSGWLSENYAKKSPEELAETVLLDKENAILKDARVASIIEFGRIVHAEMSAITEAARRGVSVRGSTLFCTTFPCHMCARHIIASGIRRVVYIEPYPKSMTKKLYKNMVQVDSDDEADDDAVQFDPFVGIAPKRYFELFEMVKRKGLKGYCVEWKSSEAMPRMKYSFSTYVDIEATELTLLEENEVEFGLVEPKSGGEEMTDDGHGAELVTTSTEGGEKGS